ncbi:MAG: hypothetical protein L0Y67_07820 [Gammaproteobacteria bacterium]|nr:hypothetical protein [Gammaproteobacteria bacterium]MCI0591486.1 hypothetical protein [Gammaproteobacteria bacterium]
MQKSLIGLGFTMALLCGASFVHAERETEMFIPIGQSPGLSDKLTIIGEVQAVSADGQTITVGTPSGSHGATLTERTKIWLDRSTVKLTNLYGSSSDVQIGRTVEIDYENHTPNGSARWIKVKITEP